jgi:hypothetical protein
MGIHCHGCISHPGEVDPRGRPANPEVVPVQTSDCLPRRYPIGVMPIMTKKAIGRATARSRMLHYDCPG